MLKIIVEGTVSNISKRTRICTLCDHEGDDTFIICPSCKRPTSHFTTLNDEGALVPHPGNQVVSIAPIQDNSDYYKPLVKLIFGIDEQHGLSIGDKVIITHDGDMVVNRGIITLYGDKYDIQK